jgi:hypothetical protein
MFAGIFITVEVFTKITKYVITMTVDNSDMGKRYVNLPVTQAIMDELNEARKGGETWVEAFERWLKQGKISRN